MFVGGFVGSPPMNLLRLTVQSGHSAPGGAVAAPYGGTDAMVVLGVRPEDLAPAEEGFGFLVQVVEPLRSHLLLTWTTEGQSLRVVVPHGTAVRGGETILLRPNLAHVAWMHAATGEALESC